MCIGQIRLADDDGVAGGARIDEQRSFLVEIKAADWRCPRASGALDFHGRPVGDRRAVDDCPS